MAKTDETERAERLEQQRRDLPDAPGVYVFRDRETGEDLYPRLRSYSVTDAGDRFLISVPEDHDATPSIVVVSNWGWWGDPPGPTPPVFWPAIASTPRIARFSFSARAIGH